MSQQTKEEKTSVSDIEVKKTDREKWMNKNMPLIIGLGAFFVIFLLGFLARLCG